MARGKEVRLPPIKDAVLDVSLVPHHCIDATSDMRSNCHGVFNILAITKRFAAGMTKEQHLA